MVKCGGALVVAGVEPVLGPFGFQGVVEAFHFAVLPRAVRFDQDVVGAEGGQRGGHVTA